MPRIDFELVRLNQLFPVLLDQFSTSCRLWPLARPAGDIRRLISLTSAPPFNRASRRDRRTGQQTGKPVKRPNLNETKLGRAATIVRAGCHFTQDRNGVV